MIKGDNGIVGIFGGSKEYSGAPYFCGISALRTGSDLSYVFCHSAAAPSIKALAPDLIVLPFDDPDVTESLESALHRIHCLVIGPGLSRNAKNFEFCKHYISKSNAKAAVIDGDGITFYLQTKECLRGKKLIFTPNVREYSRMCKAILGVDDAPVIALSKALDSVVLKKGEEDLISDGLDGSNLTNGKLYIVEKRELRGDVADKAMYWLGLLQQA